VERKVNGKHVNSTV